MIGYLQAKARRYMSVGALRYARADHFHLPPANLSDADLLALTTGMGQLATYCGGTVNDPIIGLTLNQVRLLLATLHFRVISQQIRRGRRGNVDEYDAEHVVTGKPLTLFVTTPITSECSSQESSVEGLG